MKAKLAVAVAIVVMLLTAGILLWPRADVDEEVFIKGAMVVREEENALFLRAFSPLVEVGLDCPGDFLLFIDNINPETIMEGVPPEAIVTMGTRNITISLPGSGYYNMRFGSDPDGGFVFFVIGDTHGFSGPLEDMLDDAEEAAFVLHCGDLTPSSTREQFSSYLDQIGTYSTPVFTTPGNHDFRDLGANYTSILAPEFYSFEYGGSLFVSVPSPQEKIENSSLDALEMLLEDHGGQIFIFIHAPPVFGGRTSEACGGERLHALAAEHGNATVFNGHEHRYSRDVLEGVEYYTTGGGGASLYAPREQGGYNHYLRVEVGQDGNSTVVVEELPPPEFNPDSMLSVNVGHGNITISLEEMQAMPSIAGSMSFQNRFGNWRGPNEYVGVELSYLVEMAGGMGEDDVLELTAGDEYAIRIGYKNVYPDAAWMGIQGPLVIAYMADGQAVPDWADGLRLVALPSDGNCSNQDVLDTTPAGIAPPNSAGERCIRNVVSIRVV